MREKLIYDDVKNEEKNKPKPVTIKSTDPCPIQSDTKDQNLVKNNKLLEDD